MELDAPAAGNPRGRFPFNVSPSWTVSDSVVYFDSGEYAEVRLLRQDGTVGRIIRWRVERPTITSEDFRQYGEERAALVAADPLVGEMVPTREQHPHPDFRPFYASIRVGLEFDSAFRIDDRGWLWIRQHSRRSLLRTISTMRRPSPAQEWWIFDHEGKWIGDVTTPRNFTVKSVTHRAVIGIRRDEWDAEEILSYPVTMGN